MLRAVSVFLLLSVSTSAVAQAPAPMPVGPWVSEWKAPFCVVSTGNPSDLAVSIESVPASNGLEIYFRGASGRVPKSPWGFKATIQLAPSSTAIPANVVWTDPQWNGVLKLVLRADEFLTTFGNASEIVVQGKKQPLVMHLESADEALRALQDCTDAKMKDWGIEPAALSALKARPYADPGGWMSNDDYPHDALDEMRSGVAVVRLAIDAAGKVTNCAIAYSSGMQSMDNVTCYAALKRAKFSPAIGADGRATSATVISYSRFTVVP